MTVSSGFDDGSVVKGHKGILSVRSEYFRRMFTSHMREANDDRVGDQHENKKLVQIHLEGTEKDTFKLVLEFLYTGR